MNKWILKAKEEKCPFKTTLNATIGQLHDDVILLQLPESLSLLFSCAN